MAVIIRCRRTGANNDPCFRIVATDERCPRDGKYLEMLGWYDPKKAQNNFQLKLDRIDAWRSKGALISATVHTLLNKAKRGLTSTTARRTKPKTARQKKKKTEPVAEQPAPEKKAPEKKAPEKPSPAQAPAKKSE
jgi:small subunit ribosomal protein S16